MPYLYISATFQVAHEIDGDDVIFGNHAAFTVTARLAFSLHVIGEALSNSAENVAALGTT
jgi:hypothetical protein